jgi:dipeptidyl aminopeptidase/acylaminoacyl peptidase
VAVEVTYYTKESNESETQIWVLPTDPSSGSPLMLTSNKAASRAPAWSPDGKHIAFTSKREGDDQSQVYLIGLDGGEARRLTSISTGASSPKWFSDSSRIAFVSWVWTDLDTDSDQGDRLAERAKHPVKAVVAETSAFRFWDHWLADGRVPHVCVVDVDTGESRDAMAGTGLVLMRFENSVDLPATLFDISPDGTELAITADLSDDFGYTINTDVVTVSLVDGSWKNITEDNKASDALPAYSPDGKTIAFLRQIDEEFYADRNRLALIPRKGGPVQVLTEGWDRSVHSAMWQRDGSALLFNAEDDGRQHLFRLTIGGDKPERIGTGGSVNSFDVSLDGETLVYARASLSTPEQLFASSIDGSDERKIESFNDALVESWDLGKVEDIRFAGHGGDEIHAWVVFPPDFDPARKWPLLQLVHGGPHAAWLDTFHLRWNPHVFAARGFVCVGVNYHGSSSYGQSFTESSLGTYGTKEFEDVEKATDALIAKGYIDESRLSAGGGSYGGYMVAWMNGHTDRYKAYICHAGVYDWVSMMASDIVADMGRSLGAFPWENPELVHAQSPHYFAGEFKTPTLVIHGELDYRVPVTQGFAYYATLRRKKVPARLVYFPDENHWILKPQNSRLWYGEFFSWLARYV